MGAAFLQLELSAEDIERVTIPFGEWLPDLQELDNPGALEALNVFPAANSYLPFPAHSPISTMSVPSLVRGAAAMFMEADLIEVYAGTINGIYSGRTTLTSVFTSAVPLFAENAWQFLRVSDEVVAIHPEVTLQAKPVGSGVFTPVGGAPPTAKCGAYIKDFLVVGNLTVDPDGGVGSFPRRIRWGGFNNIDAPWVTDPATQADFQDMPAAGGEVIGIVGRDVGIIFQARGVSRMAYEGLPSVFTIDTVENNRGALSRDCIVDIGPAIFYIADDGFFMYNGTNSVPIGDNKVNKYFFNRLKYQFRRRIVGAVDYVNGCIVWAFPTDISGDLTELIIFSYRENKWSHSIQTLEVLFSTGVSSTSLDDLLASLESYAASFDSAAYQSGGRPQLAAFDVNHTYGLFGGANLAATLDTGLYTGPGGRRVFVNQTRPNVDLAFPVATAQVMQRDQILGEPVSFGTAVGQEINGECPTIADARFVRFRVNLPVSAIWNHAIGIDIARKLTGLV